MVDKTKAAPVAGGHRVAAQPSQPAPSPAADPPVQAGAGTGSGPVSGTVSGTVSESGSGTGAGTPPAPAGQIIQRYRFRVRAADGRELSSHITTVVRPIPGAAEAPAAPPMVDVPVHSILVSVTATKQGALTVDPSFVDQKGTAPTHQFAATAFVHSVTSPRDPASGLPTGRRQHHPLYLTQVLGPATPQLYSAICTNESLATVIFDCYGADPISKKTVLAHTVKLTNANVASIDLHQPNTRDPKLTTQPETIQVGLAYESIEWTHGPSMASDTWQA